MYTNIYLYIVLILFTVFKLWLNLRILVRLEWSQSVFTYFFPWYFNNHTILYFLFIKQDSFLYSLDLFLCNFIFKNYSFIYFFSDLYSWFLLIFIYRGERGFRPYISMPPFWFRRASWFALRKLYFQFLSSWMGYDHGDSFPFDFKLNGNPFGSKLNE